MAKSQTRESRRALRAIILGMIITEIAYRATRFASREKVVA